jgi:hypothetical protein
VLLKSSSGRGSMSTEGSGSEIASFVAEDEGTAALLSTMISAHSSSAFRMFLKSASKAETTALKGVDSLVGIYRAK